MVQDSPAKDSPRRHWPAQRIEGIILVAKFFLQMPQGSQAGCPLVAGEGRGGPACYPIRYLMRVPMVHSGSVRARER